MDFIERIFGVSPDGGSGAFEAMLFALPVVIVAVLMRHRLWTAGEGLRDRLQGRRRPR